MCPQKNGSSNKDVITDKLRCKKRQKQDDAFRNLDIAYVFLKESDRKAKYSLSEKH